ncbi:caspase family protein [Streptomyces doebereineriae]|uniref:Caspase family protein n=1 Tax=Streptomyces doebereineriae TaxID=3075528 RepID=A0ABU2VCQ9_9ACTN|nr:caspase family protein [Streptomyces sp. DSM 41640]MDT0483025.1 caspase family protein [Streptomyces sp. DSM 41640]
MTVQSGVAAGPPNPARTYAVVVAVSQYAYGSPDWDRPALDEDAARFSAWLRSSGVPSEHIIELKGAEATVERVRSVLVGQVPLLHGDFLWVYWAGHGVIDKEDRLRLLLAGQPANDMRNLGLEDLLALYRTSFLPGFTRQTFVIDACQQDAERMDIPLGSPLDLPPSGEKKDEADQQVWVAAQLNTGAAYGPQGGLFSAAVLSLLGAGRTLDGTVTEAELQRGVRAEADRAGLGGARDDLQEPIRVLYRNSGGSREPMVLLARPARDGNRPPGQTSSPPVAHRIPLPPPGVTSRAAPDDRFRVRLETRWCLTSGQCTDVLADPSGDDLVELLSRTEQLLQRVLSAHDPRHAPPEARRWYVHEVDASREPASGDELFATGPGAEKPGQDPAGRGSGLIVRLRADDGPPADWPLHLGHLRRLAPGLRVVVVQIHGADADAVHETAVRVARDLRCGEYLFRRARPPRRAVSGSWRTLTRAVDVRSALADTGTATVRLDGPAIVADLNTRDGERTERDARTGPEGPADLPGPDGQHPSTPHGQPSGRGDWQAERDMLASVAARWPSEYPALAEAHAAGRRGAGRYASLLLAAADDAELGRWLGAAGRQPPGPDDFPGVRVPRAVADAMVLGLLRDRQPGKAPELHGWQHAHLSSAVRAAYEVALRGTPPTLADLDRSEEAVTLDRAGLLAGTDLWALDPRGLCRGTWTLLTRWPLTEDTAGWLAGVPEARRRLVGLSAQPSLPDASLEWDEPDYREALRPPLPSG